MSGPGNKPLTSAVFYILLGLGDGPRHGLGIADEVERRSDGETVLAPGSLYTAIRNALELGLIRDADAPEGEAADPRRKYYRLTSAGREALAAEARRLRRLVDAVRDLRTADGGRPR